MTDYTNGNVCLEECPICKSVLTSWNESQYGHWVCDACGFGKSSRTEYMTLQKIVRYREKWFSYSWMKNSESSYLPRELLAS